MKVNLNKPFISLNGTETKDENGNTQIMSDIVCAMLFSGDGSTPDENGRLSATKKMKAFELMMKIRTAKLNNDDITLSAEEIVMIKEACSPLNVGGYGQLATLLNQ